MTNHQLAYIRSTPLARVCLVGWDTAMTRISGGRCWWRRSSWNLVSALPLATHTRRRSALVGLYTHGAAAGWAGLAMAPNQTRYYVHEIHASVIQDLIPLLPRKSHVLLLSDKLAWFRQIQ